MKNTGSHIGYLRLVQMPKGENRMTNKVNQNQEYRIYINESKSWVDVNKEFYTNYCRDINTYRKRQQEHGRCICPASKRYLCDMDCLTCPYAKAGDQLSLDNTISDGDGNEKSWLDDMSDESAAIAEVLEDTELLHALYAKLNELDPEGRLICQLIMQGKSERDCGKEMGLSRNTFVYRRDKLFKKLRSELKDICDVIVKRYIEQVDSSEKISVIRDGLTYSYDEIVPEAEDATLL